jgi:hypothetical protein
MRVFNRRCSHVHLPRASLSLALVTVNSQQMFVVTEPCYPRAPAEKLFSGLYMVGVLLLFGALVITLDNYTYRLQQTYSSFSSVAGAGGAQLSADLVVLLRGCAFNQTVSMGGMDVVGAIDESSSAVPFMSHALIILGVIITMFVIVINAIVAVVCFTANIRHVRVLGLSVPVTTIAANAMLVQSIAILILIGVSGSGRAFLNSYVLSCADRYAQRNATEFALRENFVQNVWGTNLGLIVVAVAVNLAIYVLGFVALCVDGLNSASAAFENRRYFWERGPLCVPDKKTLFRYARWRRFALECLGSGIDIELAPASYVEFCADLEAAKARYGGIGDDEDPDGVNHLRTADADTDGGGGGADAVFRRGGGAPAGAFFGFGGGADGGDADADDDGDGIGDTFGGGVTGISGGPLGGGFSDIFAGWRGTAADVPGGGDAPEELVVPDGFGDGDGDGFGGENDDGGDGGDFGDAAAGGGGGRFAPSQDSDRPFPQGGAGAGQRGPRQSRNGGIPAPASPASGPTGGIAAGDDSEAARRERHRQRRAAETEADRQMRKERRRRVKEMVERQAAAAAGGGGLSPTAARPYGARAAPSRPIAPPAPSP